MSKLARQFLRGIRVWGVYDDPITRKQATRFERSYKMHLWRCKHIHHLTDPEPTAYQQAWIETFGRPD